MKVHCNVIQDLLPLYHDGVCSRESRDFVETHLQSCECCRNELKMMDDTYNNCPPHPNDEKLVEAASLAWKKKKKRAFFSGSIFAVIIIVVIALVFFVPYTKFGMTTTVNVWEEQLTILAERQIDSGIKNGRACFGYRIATYPEEQCVFFEYQGTNYSGFFYTRDGGLIGFQGTNAEFERHGDGWFWKEVGGDNWMYVEHIVGNWYWYEMHF